MSNLVFAHFFSANAKITRRMVVGSALVVGGTVLACVFGPSTVAEFEVQELVDFWTVRLPLAPTLTPRPIPDADPDPDPKPTLIPITKPNQAPAWIVYEFIVFVAAAAVQAV